MAYDLSDYELAPVPQQPVASSSPATVKSPQSNDLSDYELVPPLGSSKDQQDLAAEKAQIDSFFPKKPDDSVNISAGQPIRAEGVNFQPSESRPNAPVSKQIQALPKTVKDKLAEVGLGTAYGVESMRSNLQGAPAKMRAKFDTPVLSDRLPILSGEADTTQAKKDIQESEAASKGAKESAADFAAESQARGQTKSPGAITSIAKGLTGGAAMAALAEVGGTPLMAMQGATEAYGNAKASGQTESDAEMSGVRTLLALAAFGGSNSVVKEGIAAHMGDAPAMQKFLAQAFGQSAGNEVTSRVIAAYEAALDAPEGQRLKAAAEAAKKFDIANTAQNLAFGFMGALGEAKGGVKDISPDEAKQFSSIIQAIPEEQFDAAIKQYRTLPDADPRKRIFENEIVRRNANPAPEPARPTLTEVKPAPSEIQQLPVAQTVSSEHGKRSALFEQAKAAAVQPLVIASEAAKTDAPVAAQAAEAAAQGIQQTSEPKTVPLDYKIPERSEVVASKEKVSEITPEIKSPGERFALDVRKAASKSSGKFGDSNAFISKVFEEMKANGSIPKEKSMGEFKDDLLKGMRDGNISLARSDFTAGFSDEQRKLWEKAHVKYGNEDFHFIGFDPEEKFNQEAGTEKSPTTDVKEPAAKLVGPALSNEAGKVLAKGKIGQAHVDLAEEAVENAVNNGDVRFDFTHGFHDEQGNIISREDAADRALETGQIDQSTYDKAMARKNSQTSPNNRGLHSEDLNKGVGAKEFAENPQRDAVQARVNAIKTDIAKNVDASSAWKKNRRKDLKVAEAELARHEAKIETPEEIEQHERAKGYTTSIPQESAGESSGGKVDQERVQGSGDARETSRVEELKTALQNVREQIADFTEEKPAIIEALQRTEKRIRKKLEEGLRSAEIELEVKASEPISEEHPIEDAASDPTKFSDEQLFEHADEPWAEEEIARRAALEEPSVEESQTEGGDQNEKRNEEEGRQEGVLTLQPVEGEAVPPPLPETSKSGETTALKRSVVDRQAEEQGRQPQEVPQRATPEDRVKASRETLQSNPQTGEDLIARIVDRGETGITAQDAATVLAVRRNTVTKRNRMEDILGSEQTSESQKEEARKSLELIEARMERIDKASRAAGTEWSDIGRTYQMDLREDFSREGLERKERAQRGRPLSEEERNTIKEQAEKIKELQDKLDSEKAAHEKELETTAVAETYERDIKDIEQEGKKTKKGALKVAREVVDRWKQEAEEESKNLKNFFGSESGGVGGVGGGSGGKKIGEAERQSKVVSLAKVIRARVAEFGLDRIEALKNAVETFGEKVRPFFNEAWGESQKLIASEKKQPKTIDQAKAAVKADSIAGEQLSQKAVAELVRAHIRAGVHGEDALMSAAHKDIQESYPDATERDVRRAYSEYGKVRFPNKEEVAKEAREIRTLVRLQESIDRETEGLSALHTGLQRDKATQSIREKTKQLNELLKQREGTTPSAEKLASRDQAKQTALRNAIADLDKQLKTGEKPEKSAASQDSPATEQLRAERDAMVEKLREIEASENPPKSEDQRKLESLQSRAEELRKQIADGSIQPKTGKPTVDTKDVADAKKEIESLNKQIADMRKAETPPKSPAQKQIDRLTEIKGRLDDVLSGKADPKKAPDWNPLSSEAETIQGEIQAMRELAAQMKRDAKPLGTAEGNKERDQIRRLEESIERYSQKTANKDFESKLKRQGPDTRRVAQLKEIRDSRRLMYEAVKKAGIPVRSAEEIYNERRMAQIQKALKIAQDKLATDDVAPAPPRVLRPKTAEVAKAEMQLAEAKQAIKERYKQIQFESRPPLAKALEAITGLAKGVTALAVTGHGGVGMFTHAGALAWRPSSMKLWGENFVKQFKLWANPEFHEQAIHELKNHPKFQFWKDAGSAINPDEIYTDYGIYAKTLEKIPGMKAFIKGGKRGFDALKLMRLQLNEAEWEKVPAEIKADPVQAKEAAKYIAALNNKATGAAPRAEIIPERGQKGRMEQAAYNLSKNPLVEAAFFAPRLYASRFMRVAFDPFTTIGAFMNWKNESPAVRYNAVTKLRNAAGFAAGYTGALLLNQALLSAAGSQQKVNISDPTKRDWLKFKAGGKEVIADGGLLDPMRLIGQVVVGDLIQNRTEQEKFRQGSRFDKAAHDMMQYIRGKLNPTAGLVVDSSTGADFMGRPVPWNKEKQTPKEAQQHPKYNWPEWIASHGPIPIAGATKIVYDDLRKRGWSDVQARDFLKAAAYTAVGLTGVHVSEDNSSKKRLPKR